MATNEEDVEDLEVVEKVKKVVRPPREIKVMEHDTPKTTTEEIIEIAQTVLDSIPEEHSYKDLAFALKTKLDAQFGGTWHCIVGKHFGGNVTNDQETLVNFRINDTSFLVLRSGPPERPPPEAPEDTTASQ